MSRKDRKFKGFFRPKLGDLQKKKKKEKGFRQNSGRFFSQFRKFKRLRGGSFRMGGGLFSIFHRKSASKAQKSCDFAYFTSQWGGTRAPPPPPWLRYCWLPVFFLLVSFSFLQTRNALLF